MKRYRYERFRQRLQQARKDARVKKVPQHQRTVVPRKVTTRNSARPQTNHHRHERGRTFSRGQVPKHVHHGAKNVPNPGRVQKAAKTAPRSQSAEQTKPKSKQRIRGPHDGNITVDLRTVRILVFYPNGDHSFTARTENICPPAASSLG